MIQSRKPSIKSLELQKAGIELFTGSPKSLDDAAKALMVLETSLLTAYIGIFTFFKINEKLNLPHITEFLIIILFMWLLSIICSVLAFAPFNGKIDLNCVTEIEDTLYKISNRKQKYLLTGFILFIIFILLSIGVLWFGSQSSSCMS